MEMEMEMEMDAVRITSSGSNGDATSDQEKEMQSDVAERSHSVTSGDDICLYSVTARWFKRVTEFQNLKCALEEWCKAETLSFDTLDNVAPLSFQLGNTITFPCGSADTPCQQNQRSKRFIEITEEKKQATKEHNAGMTKRTRAERDLVRAQREGDTTKIDLAEAALDLAKKAMERASATMKRCTESLERCTICQAFSVLGETLKSYVEAKKKQDGPKKACHDARNKLEESITELQKAEETHAQAKIYFESAKEELARTTDQMSQGASNVKSSNVNDEMLKALNIATTTSSSADSPIIAAINTAIAAAKKANVDQTEEMIRKDEAMVAAKKANVAANEALVAAKKANVADKATIVAANEAIVAANEANVTKLEEMIRNYADALINKAKDIYDRHCTVMSIFGGLKAAGNDTALTRTADDQQVKSSLILSSTRFAENPHPSCLSKFEVLCTPPAVLEPNACDFLVKLENDHVKVLGQFYSYLAQSFQLAEVLKKGDEQCKDKIAQTVKGIISWEVNTTDERPVQFFAPGYKSQETEEVQPIMYAIMVKIAKLLTAVPQHITAEQGIPRLDRLSGRYVDFVVIHEEEYLRAIPPAMLGIPIEVKPVTRTSCSTEKLLLQAQNQLIGHLAKRCVPSLDFAGIGEDCKVFGLELTMASVSVVVLELSGVGTDEVDIETSRSKRVPLFDKDTRANLFQEEDVRRGVENSFDTNKEGRDGAQAFDENVRDMPAGFFLLARTIMSVQKGLGTVSINGSGCHLSLRPEGLESPIKTVQHLGSGAFAHALELEVKNGNDGVFLKMPKTFQMVKALERESNALKALRLCDNIPKLYDTNKIIRTLDIKIRCEMSQLPCLPLKGLIGLPANQGVMVLVADKLNDALQTIFRVVYDALEFASGKGWAHLDVRPSNIITRDDRSDGGGFHVMLIDWGCAHSTNSKLKGFIGCPPYAHDKLFGLKREWQPSLCHDLASLAYSIASLYTRYLPWSGFANQKEVTDDNKKVRLE